MILEIVLTDTERGVLTGSSGFCPVAMTKTTPSSTLKPLVDLAKKQVKHANTLRDHSKHFYSHFPLTFDGQRFHLLTRGTQRALDSNEKESWLVHQILLTPESLKTCGPAAILADENVWMSDWNTQPQFLKSRDIEVAPLSAKIGKKWKSITGDAGWASAPLEAWEQRKPCVLVTNESCDIDDALQLFVETQSLLDNQTRWQIGIAVGAWHPFSAESRLWLAFELGTKFEIESNRGNAVRLELGSKLDAAQGQYSASARHGARILIGHQSNGNGKPTSDHSSTVLTSTDDQESSSSKSLSLASKAKKERLRKMMEQAKESNELTDLNTLKRQQADAANAEAETAFLKRQFFVGLVFTGVVIVIGIFWYGISSINQFANNLNTKELPGVVTATADDDDDDNLESTNSTDRFPKSAKNIQPAQVNKSVNTNTADSPSTSTDDDSNLEDIAKVVVDSWTVEKAFRNGTANQEFKLDEQSLTSKHKMYTLPLNVQNLSTMVNVRLQTTTSIRGLPWNLDTNNWVVFVRQDGDRIPVAHISPRVNEKSETPQTEIWWEWLDTKQNIEQQKLSEVLTGNLVFMLDRDATEMVSMPLASPLDCKPFDLASAVLSPLKFELAQGAYLCSKPVFERFRWQIARYDSKQFSESNNMWLSPEEDFENPGVFRFPIDEAVLTKRLEKVLDFGINEVSEYSGIAKKQLDFHGPFGVELESAITTDQKFLILTPSVHVMIASPRQDKPDVILESNTLKPGKDVVREAIMKGLMNHLGLKGNKMKEIVAAGGIGAKSLGSPRDCFNAALAGVLYSCYVEFLEHPIQVEVHRKREIGLNSEIEFTIPVIKINPHANEDLPPIDSEVDGQAESAIEN